MNAFLVASWVLSGVASFALIHFVELDEKAVRMSDLIWLTSCMLIDPMAILTYSIIKLLDYEDVILFRRSW